VFIRRVLKLKFQNSSIMDRASYPHVLQAAQSTGGVAGVDGTAACVMMRERENNV
jgi:hypothetical protein